MADPSPLPSPTLHFAVRNPARPGAVADVLSVPASASVGDVKAALAAQYEGAPPLASQTVRVRGVLRHGRPLRATERETRANRMERAFSRSLSPACPISLQLIYAGRVLRDDTLRLVDVLGSMVSAEILGGEAGALLFLFFVPLLNRLSPSLHPFPFSSSGRRARPARPAPGHQGARSSSSTTTLAPACLCLQRPGRRRRRGGAVCSLAVHCLGCDDGCCCCSGRGGGGGGGGARPGC